MTKTLKNLSDQIKMANKGGNVELEKVPINSIEESRKFDNNEQSNKDNKVAKNNVLTQNDIANENINKKSKKVDALISKIKASSKETKSGENMIHTRVDEKCLKRLKILNASGLSTQAIVSYLVADFLEKEEVKSLIKTIIENDLE